ncbi:MAG: hypothetical protein ACTS6P_01345 [Candidatus Hodgkinia cicadicola]
MNPNSFKHKFVRKLPEARSTKFWLKLRPSQTQVFVSKLRNLAIFDHFAISALSFQRKPWGPLPFDSALSFEEDWVATIPSPQVRLYRVTLVPLSGSRRSRPAEFVIIELRRPISQPINCSPTYDFRSAGEEVVLGKLAS